WRRRDSWRHERPRWAAPLIGSSGNSTYARRVPRSAQRSAAASRPFLSCRTSSWSTRSSSLAPAFLSPRSSRRRRSWPPFLPAEWRCGRTTPTRARRGSASMRWSRLVWSRAPVSPGRARWASSRSRASRSVSRWRSALGEHCSMPCTSRSSSASARASAPSSSRSACSTADRLATCGVFESVNGSFGLLGVLKLGFFVAILPVFSLMLSDFFDTAGTVVSVASEGGWLKKDGSIDRVDRVFWVDSLGALFGGIFGTSSNTTYIESGSGVAEGAKTGLASLVTAVLFLLAIFLAPIAGIVPQQATAPALMLVGWFMFKPILDLHKIDNIDFATGFAVLLTLFVMPLTYSITTGVGAGFIVYSALKVEREKANVVSIPLWRATAAFARY